MVAAVTEFDTGSGGGGIAPTAARFSDFFFVGSADLRATLAHKLTRVWCVALHAYASPL